MYLSSAAWNCAPNGSVDWALYVRVTLEWVSSPLLCRDTLTAPSWVVMGHPADPDTSPVPLHSCDTYPTAEKWLELAQQMIATAATV